MIKARLSTDDREILLIGLSAENRKRLGEDQPIRITVEQMNELGLPLIEIVIMGGETEESMVAELRGLRPRWEWADL